MILTIALGGLGLVEMSMCFYYAATSGTVGESGFEWLMYFITENT